MAHRSGWRRLVLVVMLTLVSLPAMAGEQPNWCQPAWRISWKKCHPNLLRIPQKLGNGMPSGTRPPEGRQWRVLGSLSWGRRCPLVTREGFALTC